MVREQTGSRARDSDRGAAFSPGQAEEIDRVCVIVVEQQHTIEVGPLRLGAFLLFRGQIMQLADQFGGPGTACVTKPNLGTLHTLAELSTALLSLGGTR
jgi:hypothetical protein